MAAGPQLCLVEARLCFCRLAAALRLNAQSQFFFFLQQISRFIISVKGSISGDFKKMYRLHTSSSLSMPVNYGGYPFIGRKINNKQVLCSEQSTLSK